MNTPGWLKTNVSRETLNALESYVGLIKKWNPVINLVSKSSLSEIWERHIWDSAQLVDIPTVGDTWADFGSGGGLPGLVLAIFSREMTPNRKFSFVESDQRKAAFLMTVSRELSLNTQVYAKRIEQIDPLNADIISARALTDLTGLLNFVDLHGHKGTIALFPKGETWENELTHAKDKWSFQYEKINSKTNANAAILKIEGIASAGP